MVYLLHFQRPFHHARHYMGMASKVDIRLRRHALGSGSKLLKAVHRAGIRWELVATWEGGFSEEIAFKLQHNGPRFCPVCRQEAITKRLWKGKGR